MQSSVGDISQYRLITEFEDVIRVLGGVVEVSKIVHRSRSAVCNWRNNGARFPASHFPQIQAALMERHCIAVQSLFTFLNPHTGSTAHLPMIDVA